MKLAVILSDGSALVIEDFDADTAFGLAEELRVGTLPFLTLEMDEATVLVNRNHIMRIDMETAS